MGFNFCVKEIGWPTGIEGAEIKFDKGHFVLNVFLSDPEPEVVKAINKPKMGLANINGEIFFIFVFCGREASTAFDAPFSPHLCDELPDLKWVKEEDAGYEIQVNLIDSSVGRLLKTNIYVLRAAFSNLFNKMCEKALATPFSYDQHIHNIKEVNSTMTLKDMLEIIPIIE